MVGSSSNRHNRIATNALLSLGVQLKGKPCQAFNSDTKVKIQRGVSAWFYYPDALVVCDKNPQDDSYQQSPILIVEVLSKSTRAVNLDEKLTNHLFLDWDRDLPAPRFASGRRDCIRWSLP